MPSSEKPKPLYIECDLPDEQTLADWRRGRGERHGRWSALRALHRLAHRGRR
jgi:hypothetical protein